MKPVLFQLPTPFGTFPVSSFGVFLLLAFIVAITLTRARTRRLGWDPGEVVDLALYAIIGGIIGARIGYVLVNARDFAMAPLRALMIWGDAGLTFYGALLGGPLVAWPYGRLFWLFVLLLAIARFGIETFMDSPRALGPLTLAQVASLVVGRLAAVMWLVLGRGLPDAAPLVERQPEPAPPGMSQSGGGSH